MRGSIDRFASSTNRAKTTFILKDSSRQLSYRKPFAERYWLPFNSAAHTDARETPRFLSRRATRAGGCER